MRDTFITLTDADTGVEAVVLGDDGVSRFPATITSGGTVKDSGGNVYNFLPGKYRYPLLTN